MVSKETFDKIKGYLISSGFEEQQKKPGLWLKGERPHMRLVDLFKDPFEYAVTDGITRQTEGHGVLEMEEVQQVIEGIIFLNEPNPTTKPQKPQIQSPPKEVVEALENPATVIRPPSPPKSCSCHSNKNKDNDFGGLFEDPERLERYQKLFADAFPGQTALDVLNRKPKKEIHIHIHIHVRVHSDETVTTEVEK